MSALTGLASVGPPRGFFAVRTMKPSRFLRLPTAAIARFLRLEAAAGLLLMGAAILALILANSTFASAYRAVLAAEFGLSILHWINDGLMAVFFLLVGLEIKRELLVGELSTAKRLVLPAVAAGGGMIVPAIVYLAINWHQPDTLRGWAIPAATDIAFALGVLALLGKRVPLSLKLFLTALAILDDLGAIIIIACFYTADLSLVALMAAAIGIGALFFCNRLNIRNLAPYIAIGLIVWCAVLLSGVHATLAGVAVAAFIPLKGKGEAQETSPLHRLEHLLHPFVAYCVLPIFSLANAGLSFNDASMGALLSPIPLGILCGLVLGKQIGVYGASWLAVKAGWAEWPEGATPVQVYGVALLCGIGFTMSLFIGSLAFSSDALQNQVKLGVFTGSVLAAFAGYLVLRFATPKRA